MVCPCCPTVLPCHHTVSPCRHTVSPCCHTVSPCHHTVSPCHHTVSPCHHTVSPCHHTVSPCCHSVSPCHHTVSPCRHTVSPCCTVVISWVRSVPGCCWIASGGASYTPAERLARQRFQPLSPVEQRRVGPRCSTRVAELPCWYCRTKGHNRASAHKTKKQWASGITYLTWGWPGSPRAPCW